MALIHFDKKEEGNELWRELFLMDNYLSFKENLLNRKIRDTMTVLKRGLLSGKWRYL